MKSINLINALFALSISSAIATATSAQVPQRMEHGQAVRLLNPDSLGGLVRTAHDQPKVCGAGRLTLLDCERAETHHNGL